MIAQPEEHIEPGERYCPKCGGTVGADARGRWICTESHGVRIGCGWSGADRDTPVATDDDPTGRDLLSNRNNVTNSEAPEDQTD